MAANEVVLKSLAEDGVLVTEKELLDAIRVPQPNVSARMKQPLTELPNWDLLLPVALPRGRDELNGSVKPQVKSEALANRAVGPQNMAQHPEPGNGNTHRRLVRGITTAWQEVWLAPFRALREVYWLFDEDSKVRSQGLQIVGRVLAIKTREETNSEGDTYYTHHVTYAYQVDARRYEATQQVCSLGDLKQEAPIRVYFLPNTPFVSAVDPRPWALSEELRPSLEMAKLGSRR